MMELKVDSRNRKVLAQLKNLEFAAKEGIRKAFYFIGKKIVKDVRDDIRRKPRFGRTYFRRTKSGRRIKHVASVSGEAPANITGTLARSTDFEVRGSREMELGYHADYGKYLEDKQKLNRPGLEINIKKNEKITDNYFKQEIDKEIKRTRR